MIFEVGKTYLTRDGRKVLMKSYTGAMIMGTTRWKGGDESTHLWYDTGNYFFSGQSPMDLMPWGITGFSAVTEPELEGKAMRERGIESALIKLGWTPPGKKSDEDAKLQAEVETLREENAQLRTQLNEARLIAQGMVDSVKCKPRTRKP